MWHEIRSALLLCQLFVRCEVSLPHFRPVLAANDLKFNFCTSGLPGLVKVSSFSSAIPLYLYCQRSEVPLSVLPLRQDVERYRSSSSLVLQGLPNMGKSTSVFHLCRDFQRCEVPLLHLLCLNCQRYEVQLPHFRSARTFNGLTLCFRTSALSLWTKIWSFAFHTSARPGFRRSRSSSALVLPGLPNMGKATFAFHLCRDFQRCEVPLPHFCSALTAKDLKFCFLYLRSARTSKDVVHLPQLFCQDFQIWISKPAFHLCRDFQRSECPLLHFCFALTAKDVKFCFLSSAVHSYYAFPHKFVLSWSLERRVR